MTRDSALWDIDLDGLATEEAALFQAVILHYAMQLQAERQRCAELRRRLECAEERIRVLEGDDTGGARSVAHGFSFL